MRTGGPFAELNMGEHVLVVPFPGRGGRPIGFAAAQLPALRPDLESSLDLLARFAGVLLESHLIEESRSEVRTTPVLGSSRPRLEGAADALVGESEPMKRVRKLVLQVAPVGSPVLILGETGTGKELVARAIHEGSPRRKGPFIALNCGALPESLVESELFGHEAGAFTGAQKKHRGRVEQAQGGTLFLDELGEMPKAVQVKLLRFLQDSRYVPLGAEGERTADVRIVAATNQRLDAAVAEGRFREDLLFRLNVFPIELPPLRDRGYDVILLARSFVREIAERFRRSVPELGAAAEKRLVGYDWPGNVRELRNVLERSVILSGDAIDASVLPQPRPGAATKREPPAVPPPEPTPAPAAAPGGSATLPTAEVFFVGDVLRPFAEAKDELLARFEARYCEALLAKAAGNITLAARLAGMDKKNLYRKIRAHGLDAAAHKE
jgi:DNA-binding NtrC family response regulator